MARVADRQGIILYVRSQPREYHATLDYVETSFTGRLGSMLLPPSLFGKRPDARETASAPPDEIPLEQARCVRLVLDIARRKKCSVNVVDVAERPLPETEFDARSEDVGSFPILVGPGVDRLTGLAEFTPGRVRKFLSLASRPAGSER